MFEIENSVKNLMKLPSSELVSICKETLTLSNSLNIKTVNTICDEYVSGELDTEIKAMIAMYTALNIAGNKVEKENENG